MENKRKEFLGTFIGRQIGRFFIGQVYFTAFYQLTMVLTLVKLAWDYPDFSIPLLILSGLFFIWFLGYFVDKTELNQKKQLKQYEQTKIGQAMLFREVIYPEQRKMLKSLIEEIIEDYLNGGIKE